MKVSAAMAVISFYTSAGLGHAKSQYIFSDIYISGRGVKQSNTETFCLYQKAAHQRHTEAQYNISVMYDYGRGVKQSDTYAFFWYEKAAHRGLANTQFYLLGVMQMNDGRGVNQSDRRRPIMTLMLSITWAPCI